MQNPFKYGKEVKGYQFFDRRRHALGNASTLHSAQRELVRRGILETDKTRSFVGDPFFARYIRHSSAARVLI